MPWTQIAASLAPAFAHRDRKGRPIDGADLFGPSLVVAGAGVSNAGGPRLPIRLMMSLLYLKHAYDGSGESRRPGSSQTEFRTADKLCAVYGAVHRHLPISKTLGCCWPLPRWDWKRFVWRVAKRGCYSVLEC